MATTVTFGPVPIGVIKGMIELAGKDDVRNYLNALCFERSRGESMIIATDGMVIGVKVIPHPTDPTDPDCVAIVPRAALEMAIKLKAAEVTVIAETGDDKNRKTALQASGIDIQANSLTGFTYPDWRRVMDADAPPAGAETETPLIDARLVLKLQKAWEAEHKKSIVFQPLLSGSKRGGPCLVSFRGDATFIGCVMSTRGEAKDINHKMEPARALLRRLKGQPEQEQQP